MCCYSEKAVKSVGVLKQDASHSVALSVVQNSVDLTLVQQCFQRL